MKSRHRLFVAQSAEYAELVKILTARGPGGALILGGLGIGKTTLVRAALARNDVPAPAMRVHCSPTLADEPYGALSPYLSVHAPTDSPAYVLREISAVLEASPAPIVVVEDAEFLDDETTFILSTLVENGAIKLIAIGHGRADGESTLFSLVESGLLSTIAVQPLSRDGVRFLAEELAGCEFTEAAIDVIVAMTGGNPTFVEAYIQACLDQGLVARDPDAGSGRLAALARLAPDPDELLVELVRDVSRSVPPVHRMILELLALAGPLPAVEISGLTGGEHRRLIESGILVTGTGGLTRLASEVHALVLRSIVPPGRSAELYEVWTQHAGDPSAPLQVLWALETGAAVHPDRVLDALEKANNDRDFSLAWKLAESGAAEESDHFTLAHARTMVGLGRHYSARTLIMEVAESSVDPNVLDLALRLLIMTLDKIETEVDIEAVERAWAGGARDLGGSASAGRERAGELADLWRIVHGAISGPSSIADAERILSSGALSADGRVLTRLALADLHSLAGRTETALHHAWAAHAELSGDDRMAADYQVLVLFRIGWSLVFSGRYDEAERFLSDAREATLRTALYRAGALGVLQALLELLQGQRASSRRTLDEAVVELRLRDLPQTLSLALGLRTLTAPQTPADSMLGVGDRVRPRWVLARAVLAATMRDSLEDYPLIERELIAASADQLFAGDAAGRDAGRRLGELASAGEGSRSALLAQLARVSLSDDPSAAESLAVDAAESGDSRVAALAYARAATICSDDGDIRRCGAVLRDLRDLLARNNMMPDGCVARALSLAELTRREQEIVDLTRDGRTNAEIARVLTVSRRTVEGHLYRIFSKLGIIDRSQLMQAQFRSGTGE